MAYLENTGALNVLSIQFIRVLHSPQCKPSGRQEHGDRYVILHTLFPSTRKLSFQDCSSFCTEHRVAEIMFVFLRHESYSSNMTRRRRQR